MKENKQRRLSRLLTAGMVLAALLAFAPSAGAEEVTVNDAAALVEALEKTDDQVITLGGDITLPNDQAAITPQNSATLDLDGHTLTLGDEASTRTTDWFWCSTAGKTLTIQNSAPGEDSKLFVASIMGNGNYVFDMSGAGADLTLTDVNIEAANMTKSSYIITSSQTVTAANTVISANMTAGAPCLINTSGTLRMTDCTLTADVTGGTPALVHSRGDFVMENSTITGAVAGTDRDTKVTALQVSAGSLEMTGGEIKSSSTVVKPYYEICAVKMEEGATASFTDGKITADAAGSVYALNHAGGTITELKNMTIAVNVTANYKAYGIYQNGGSCKIESITGGGISVLSGGSGYGIYVESSAEAGNLTIGDGAVIDVVQSTNSTIFAGLFVAEDGAVEKLDDVKISVRAQDIDKNTAKNYKSPVIKNEGIIKAVTAAGTYQSHSGKAGVQNTGTIIFPTPAEGFKLTEEAGLDNGYLNSYTVVTIYTGEPVVAIDGKEYYDFCDALVLARDGQTVKLLQDIALDPSRRAEIIDKQNITLDLNGHTLSNSDKDALFVQNSSVTVTDGSGGGGKLYGSPNGLVSKSFGGPSTVTLEKGIVIEGRDCGVDLEQEGDKLTADNVTIKNNGGGISKAALYFYRPASSSVTGCTIIGKGSSSNGVEISSTQAGTADAHTVLTFTNNSISTTGSGSRAGGLYVMSVKDYADIVVTGGTISGFECGFYQDNTNSKGSIQISGCTLTGSRYGARLAKGAGESTFTNVTVRGGQYGVYNEGISDDLLTLDGVKAYGGKNGLYTEAGKTTTLASVAGAVEHYGFAPIGGKGTVTFPDSNVGFKEDGTGSDTGYRKWVLTTDTGELYDPPMVASVTVSGATIECPTFAAAFAEAVENTESTITLLRDTTEDPTVTMTIPAGTTLTIDLKGKTLTEIISDFSKDINLFTNNGTLTITDSSVSGNGEPGVGTRRGAPEGAGKITVANLANTTVNKNNRNHSLVYSAAESTLTVNQVTLEMDGETNNGAAIYMNHADAELAVIRDASILAPKYPVYAVGGIPGGIANSLIRATCPAEVTYTDPNSTPTAVYLKSTEAAQRTVGDIVNCEIDSSYFGVYATYCALGKVTQTDITATLRAAFAVKFGTVGDISSGTWTNKEAVKVVDSFPVLSLTESTAGSITEMTFTGAGGVALLNQYPGKGSTVAYIGDCTITDVGDYASSYGSGSGITLRHSTITGVEEDGRKIAIENCIIDSAGYGMDMEAPAIGGDILNCTINGVRGGIFSYDRKAAKIDGYIDGCTISTKGMTGIRIDTASSEEGYLKGIKNSTVTCDYTGTPGYDIGYALEAWGRVDLLENTTLIAKNDALPYGSKCEKMTDTEAAYTTEVTNCTFQDLDGDGYTIHNEGSMTLGRWGSSEKPGQISLRSDAVLVVEELKSASHIIPISLNGDNNPNKCTLTIKGRTAETTITHPDGHTGTLFAVETGGLTLANITVDGMGGADPLVSGGEGTTITIDPGATLKNNHSLAVSGDSVVLAGGTITGNTVASGGAVAGSLTVRGAPVVDGNTTLTGGAANVYLKDGETIILGGAGLTAGAHIGVTTQTPPTESAPVQLTAEETGTEFYKTSTAGLFSAAGYEIQANDAGKYLELAKNTYYTVTLTGVIGNPSAIGGRDYSFAIESYDSAKAYEITVTVGGAAVTPVDNGNGGFTIPGGKVIGDIVIVCAERTDNTLTVTFDPNGGDALADNTRTVTAGGTYPALPTPTRTGYSFVGWTGKIDGGPTISAGDKVTLVTNTTLYARWSIQSYTLTFDFNDGGATDSTTQTADYGADVTFLPAPPYTGYEFFGWKIEQTGVIIPKGGSCTVPAYDATFTAQWIKLGDVDVTVGDENDDPVKDASVKIMRAEVDIASATTGEDGKVVFTDPPYGIYNVVVSWKNAGGKDIIVTKSIEIAGDTLSLSVRLPGVRLNTVVEGEVHVAPDNLEEAISQGEKDSITDGMEEGGVAEITVTLTATEQKDGDIKDAMDGETGEDQILTDYVDVALKKTITIREAGGSEAAPVTTDIRTADSLLTLHFQISDALYQELAKVEGGTDHILVYRRHEGADGKVTIEQMNKVSAAAGKSAGYECYYIEEVQGVAYIAVKAQNFSTYAFGVQTTEVSEYVPGSGTADSYSVIIGDMSGGTVTASRKTAAAGTRVTLTVTPDEGYTLAGLTATDRNGRELSLKNQGDGKYTFTMPASKVNVTATFVTDYGACDRGPSCPMYEFSDVSTAAWYHDGVHYCLEHGLMIGAGGQTFQPYGATTRGTIVTILYRLEGEPKTSSSPFPDVAEGMYYTDPVGWAAANGIVKGYSGGRYAPDDPITREQLAAILYRYSAYKGYDVSRRADLTGYSGVEQISGYAVDAMSWAVAEGLVEGRGGSALAPTEGATRAETATIFMRFCEKNVK